VKHLKDQYERNGRRTRELAEVVAREESWFDAELFLYERRQSHGIESSPGFT
jgi:hypothetical protein